MRQTELPGTGVTTTRLGFGCAGLLRVGSSAARQRLLAAAYDAGIRHFDVAPMYGLGAAEPELGRFARGRRQHLVIATKFGITPGRLGRSFRHLQGPLRSVLRRLPALGRLARSRSEALYEPRTYDAAAARASLEASLRQLGTDYVDLFLLHEPRPDDVLGSDLPDFLESARRRGQVRAYGVAGPAGPTLDIRRRVPELAPVIQIPNDAICREIEGVGATDRAVVTFSPLSSSMKVVLEYLRAHESTRRRWCETLGYDLAVPENLAVFLLSYALKANPSGAVLFSTTDPRRVSGAARCAGGDPPIPEAEASLDTFLDLVAREMPERKP